MKKFDKCRLCDSLKLILIRLFYLDSFGKRVKYYWKLIELLVECERFLLCFIKFPSKYKDDFNYYLHSSFFGDSFCKKKKINREKSGDLKLIPLLPRKTLGTNSELFRNF
jgi:hypothetical protein